jgi:hypothetical protein
MTLATLVGFLLATSPLQLEYLPHYRDYSKTPFLIGACLFVTWLARAPRRHPAALISAAIAGVFLGFGSGMRVDTMMFAELAMLSILFVRGEGLLKGWLDRTSVLGVFIVCFGLVASPVFEGLKAGSAFAHVIFLGLARNHDEMLGVAPGPYIWAPRYNDSDTYAIFAEHGIRVLGEEAAPYTGPDYERQGKSHLVDVVKMFPADMLTRGIASFLQIARLPFQKDSLALPSKLDPASQYGRFFRMKREVLSNFDGVTAAVLVGITVLLVINVNLRAGLLLAAWLVILLVYPVLQFHPRHYFSLEFVGLIAIAFLVERLLKVAPLVAAIRRDYIATTKQLRIRRILLINGLVMTCFVGLALVWGGLTRYQETKVREFFNRVLLAPAEPIQIVKAATDEANRWTRISLSPLQPAGPKVPLIVGHLLRAKVGGSACPAPVGTALPLTMRYEAANPFVNPSWTPEIRIAHGATQFVSAIYESTVSDGVHFLGIEVPTKFDACLADVELVTPTSDLRPLPFAILAPDWQTQPLHQSIGAEILGRFASPFQIGRITLPLTVRGSFGDRFWASFGNAPKLLASNQISYQAPTIDIAGPKWRVDGKVAERYSYLIMSNEIEVAEPSIFAVSGSIRRGGFSAGILKNEKWVASQVADVPGTHTLFIPVQKPGRYRFVVSNHVEGKELRNEIELTRVSLLKAGITL